MTRSPHIEGDCKASGAGGACRILPDSHFSAAAGDQPGIPTQHRSAQKAVFPETVSQARQGKSRGSNVVTSPLIQFGVLGEVAPDTGRAAPFPPKVKSARSTPILNDSRFSQTLPAILPYCFTDAQKVFAGDAKNER